MKHVYKNKKIIVARIQIKMMKKMWDKRINKLKRNNNMKVLHSKVNKNINNIIINYVKI